MRNIQKAERRKLNGTRRGISVIVVLGIIAVTLAASYAIMRSQVSSVRIQQNGNRQNLARQAAMVGLSVAIRAMEQSTWAGVNTTLAGTLNGQDSYSATYTAGDDSLTPTSSAYSEFPYRVTIVSTGTSIDSSNSQSKATHKVRAVMRLIPRKLSSSPSDLATIVNYTWYQTQNDTFTFQVPLQVQGKVRVQGTVALTSDYQWTNTISDNYLDDLLKMSQNGYPDDRPFPGSLELSFIQNDATVQHWLTNTVNASLISNSATGMSAQWSFPGSISSYKLYTGGPTYSVPTAPATVTSNLQADPVNNPLGLFYSSGDVTLGSNASITGSLVGGGQVIVTGSNVVLAPFDLMPLQGSTTRIRLPTLLSSDDLIVNDTGAPTIDGLVATFDQFNLKIRPQAKTLAMHGNLVARRFVVEGRNEFNLSAAWWSFLYTAFKTQSGKNKISYFPAYLSALGLQADPSVVFQPPSNPVTYVWPANGFTVYIANPADGGLRWEIVDWRDIH